MTKVLGFKLFLFFSFLFLFLINSVSAAVPLGPPTITYPKNSDSPIWAGEIKFSWTNPGANYYQYHINLPDGTSKEAVINSIFIRIYDLKSGSHNWAVRSCNDAAGIECGAWSNSETFEIISAPVEISGGLVPCGRKYDNPATPYIIESKPCQFSDIFVLFKFLLDFILWRMAPIILVLLVVATGLTFYFSLGGPKTLARVKSIMRSAIIGYFVIFLAWVITNLTLKLLGYTVQWWTITF